MSYGDSTKKVLYRMYDKRCAYCGIPLKISELTLDHVYPKSKGGNARAHNIKPSCRFCNCLKEDLSMNMFKAKIVAESKGDSEKAKKIRHRFTIIGNHVVLYFEQYHRDQICRINRLKKAFRQIRRDIQ